MYAKKSEINKNDLMPNNNLEYELSEEMIKEVTVALKEAKEGKIISNDRLQEYFYK